MRITMRHAFFLMQKIGERRAADARFQAGLHGMKISGGSGAEESHVEFTEAEEQLAERLAREKMISGARGHRG